MRSTVVGTETESLLRKNSTFVKFETPMDLASPSSTKPSICNDGKGKETKPWRGDALVRQGAHTWDERESLRLVLYSGIPRCDFVQSRSINDNNLYARATIRPAMERRRSDQTALH